MARILRMLLAWVSRAHSAILSLNDRFEYSFTDKELHFLVIGAIGLALILLVYPVFRLLAKHNRVLAITWIYALTVLLMLTFAIEIGQSITGSGTMEFGDIVTLRLLLWAVKGIAKAIRRGARMDDMSGDRF